MPRPDDPPTGAWPQGSAPPSDSASLATPGTGRPHLIEPDSVHQPKMTVSVQRIGSSLGGLTIAMWLFVALVMGLAIGAVTGTVAALIVIG